MNNETTKQAKNQTQQTQATTSTPHFSSDELRLQVVKNQAEQDAFADARAYLEHYDHCFNNLKEKGVVNLLTHRVKTHQESLIQRQNSPINQEENLEGKYSELMALMGRPTISSSHFLPLS